MLDDIYCDDENQRDSVATTLFSHSTRTVIDTTDFRDVLTQEPTYQTLNGRMTPPGFVPSSSYATLTPLQPLPPISTMSDRFSHHYSHHCPHHPDNGGFALMQNVNSSSPWIEYG